MFVIYHVVLCADVVLTLSVRDTDQYSAEFVSVPVKMSGLRSTADGSTDNRVLGATYSFMTQL